MSASRNIAPICLLILAASNGAAAPLAVGDASFEDNNLTAGQWNTDVGPEWQASGTPIEEYIVGFSAEGTDHLGMLPGAIVWQDLATTYQPNTRYTLTVSTGNRAGHTSAGNLSTYALDNAAGGSYAAAATDASLVGVGTFADAPALVFETPDHPASIGQTIRIRLQAAGTNRSHFDNIRLDATLLAPDGTATLTNASASVITATTATLNGAIVSIGTNAPTVTFFYGPADGGKAPGSWAHSTTLPGPQSGPFSTGITDLQSNASYHFTARASNDSGDSWASASLSFSTPPAPPSADNLPAADITGTSATIGTAVTDTGGITPSVTLFYGTVDGGTTPGNWLHSISLGETETEATTLLTGLAPMTLHHYRAYAEHAGGGSWAPATASFTTLTVFPPAVENRLATGITGASATLNGEVTDTGSDTPFVSFYYGTSNGGTNAAAWDHRIEVGPQDGNFNALARNLAPQTIHYYRVRASNAGGTAWAASSATFTTTVPVPPGLVINEIHYDDPDKTAQTEFIELHNAGIVPVDLSGHSLIDGIDFVFTNGTVIPPGEFLVIAQNPSALLSSFGTAALGPWTGSLRNGGERIALVNAGGSVIDEVDYRLGFPWPIIGGAADLSIELIHPSLDNDLGGSWRSAAPSPGTGNHSYAPNAAPQIRQVDHSAAGRVLLRDRTILPGEETVITAKVTDPEGVAAVALEYQLVDPGDYINIDDPRYAASWTAIPMLDDGGGHDALGGDAVFSATIPGTVHTHRRLIRYRIVATDTLASTVRVPYADDPTPNFAYFVYGDIPTWTAADQPGVTSPHTYDFLQMEPVAVYHLITTPDDHADSQFIPPSGLGGGYGGSEYLWQGTLVYEGRVYDHIRYRARGGVWRYAMGKNMWKFDFNRGRRFQARDDYDQKYRADWSKLNFSALIQQGWSNQRGEQGLFESAGFKNHNLAGNASPKTHYVHFRIIENADENGSDQFTTDFQGLYMAVEQLDGRFLDEHELPDGSLWKIEGHNNQEPANNEGPYLESAYPHGDVDTFIDAYRTGTPTETWWRDWLDLPDYYAFRASATWIHDYDIHAGKNYFFLHNPERDQWQVVNWDLDLTWTTPYGGGGTTGPLSDDVLSIPAFQQDYRNTVRHLQDLLHNTEQQTMVLEETAHWAYTPGQPSLVDADRAMWDYNPILIEDYYVNLNQAGHGKYYEDSAAPIGTFEGKFNQQINYVAGRTNFMQSTYLVADEHLIPAKPDITNTSPSGFPADALAFASDAYSSPAGSPFAARQWRVARITLPEDPRFDPASTQYDHYAERLFEITADWTTEIATSEMTVQIPPAAVEPDDLVRVRTRVQDAAGRWSRWSDPAQFTVGEPNVALYENNLVISEVMYHPPEATGAEPAVDRDEFEFIELHNISSSTALDLAPLMFTDGIGFNFSEGAVSSLAPGGYVLLVENPEAFESRYGTGLPVAGTYSGSLLNSGEPVALSYGLTTPLIQFIYHDDIPWPAEPDGGGVSLVLADPAAAPDHSLAASWTAGSFTNGTPGYGEEPGLTFATWQGLHFTAGQLADPAISGAHADPESDGIDNLSEYAFGTGPFILNDRASLIHARIVDSGGSDYLAITFRRLVRREPLVYRVRSSSNLSTWIDDFTTLVSRTANNDGTETVTLRSNSPVTAFDAAYLKLEITLP